MKLAGTYSFIIISSFALIIVLIIQVNWILQTAKIKEQLFNEKANMVLSRTAIALNNDTATVKRMEVCVGNNDTRKVDSILRYYMNFYNVNLRYYFEIKSGILKAEASHNIAPPFTSSYATCIGDVPGKNGFSDPKRGLDLKLVFPEKEEFIIEEMGVPFISSVLLIVVVLVLSWRNILSLMREKKISEHTTEFLNNMTHEFKTPLTNIALAGKMMIKEPNIRQEEKVRHYSGIILEENEKLRLQVEQVLSMTALERGEIPVRRTELDVHQLIQDVVKRMNIQVENQQGELRLELNAENAVVMGDKTHLTNALVNLLDNAIKYSREKPEIRIRTYNTETNFVLVLSDKGIGIDSNYHEKIFDKFFRVPTGNVHNVKGFGLGLAYIKTIVNLHGGTITLESEIETGTTFTITLPHA